jgi:transcriptional regulator with GAF, ATPase, and Fis domain
MAWAASVVQYHSLALCLESLATRKFHLSLRNKIFVTVSSFFVFSFLLISILHFNCLTPTDKHPFEFILEKISIIYAMFPVILFSLIITGRKLYKKILPRILQKQLVLLTLGIIIPFWLFDILQVFPFTLSATWINAQYTLVGLSSILLTGAVLYCSFRMLGLRFLNLTKEVQSKVNVQFMENFKVILDQFSRVSSLRELGHVTQVFFKEAFGIPFNRVQLYIRSDNPSHETQQLSESNQTISSRVELFISTNQKLMGKFIKKSRLFVYDEIAFSDFHEGTEKTSAALTFLDSIQADIFLPVYENNTLIAYIIIDRHARFEELYNNTEYDEMLIFSQYLGNIIHLMQNKNLEELIRQEKDLKEELYQKHQEINQYKESIRSFLRAKNHKKIGIIFYKSRRFTFANQTAKELIQINPNFQDGHPMTKALKNLAQQVDAYKTPQTAYTQDAEGTKLVLSGVPGLEQNNVIICVYYPEVSDIIKKQIDILKDPSEWDYLLYLETTRPGKLINQLIPGSGETLLNFKIALLKTALTKKATLLNMPEKDLLPTVEILHHISLRESLQVIDLDGPEKNFEAAVKLFGINAIFQMDKDKENKLPLLERLDSIGTIFIKNIHHLSLETQEQLAEYLRYGFFKIFRSDHKIPSNVRIICSSNQNLTILMQDEKFSKSLLEELKHTTLEMPSLLTLPKEELSTLAEGFSEQAVADQSLKNILSLSPRDKLHLAHQRPASLIELKTKIQQILIQKSKQNEIYDEAQFDPAYEVSDPDLVEAARLGKKALKDQKIMTLLWNKFKNQNKIASFLGVNRSSVNRRCKEYNLIQESNA